MFNQKGFTLVELVTTVGILAVASGLLYTVFFMNWQAFDNNIAQADLSSEYNEIIKSIVNTSRVSKQINVASSDSVKQITFLDQNNVVIATYTLRVNGIFFVRFVQPVDIVLSNKMDFELSSFTKNGSALRANIVLKDQIFNKPVSFSSSIEIYPRN